MKHFTKMLWKAFAVVTVLLISLFASCSGLQELDDMVEVRVSVNEIERTLMPSFNENDFSTYKLTWKNTANSSYGQKMWNTNNESMQTAYQMMNNDVFAMKAGTYNFTLTAMDVNGAIYEDCVSNKAKTISVSDASLAFNLSFKQVSENSGTKGTVSFSASYPVEGVTYVVVKRYATTDESSYKSTAPTSIYTSSSITGNISYSNSSWNPGGYIIEFEFFGGENQDIPLLKKPWLEYCYVSAGKTSSAEINIPALDSVYDITYNNCEGAAFTTKPLSFTARMNVTLPEPVKTGYTFDGWYENVDEEGNPTGSRIEGWVKGQKTDDVTLFAKWIANVYSVKFHTEIPSDGELSDTPFMSLSAAHGGTLTAPETNPERTGYTFVRWIADTTGTQYDFENTALTGNLDLYALWTCNITFNANKEGASGTMSSQEADVSWLRVEPVNLPLNTFEAEGFLFLGWAESADASEALYSDGETVVFGQPKTLYALWHDETDGLLVTFNTNGGSAVGTQTVQSGETAEEPVSTKEEFGFKGWYTSTDNGVTLSATAYDFTTPVTTNLNLYAGWLRTTYYVKADGNNTTGDGSVSAPFATVAKAVSEINSTGSDIYDYTIVVSGELKERVSLSSSTLESTKAKTLTIRGLTGNDTDILNGNAGGTVITLNTTIPVILKDITVTNGTTNNDSRGAGIHITNGNLVLDNGCLITKNESNSSNDGTGIAIYMANGTLSMKDGAVICDNNLKVNAYYAPGIRLINGEFNMYGGEIYNNNSTNHSTGAAVDLGGTSTFNMLGGTIRNNNCKTGGAVYLRSNTSKFNIGGSAYIPYGGTIGNNSVNLNGGTVNVSETLTAQIPVATLYFPSISTTNVYVTVADGLTLSEEAVKFGVTSTNYKFGPEGKLVTKETKSIQYILDGGRLEGGTATNTEVRNHVVGTISTLQPASRPHFTFGGWYRSSYYDGEPLTILTDEDFGGSSTVILYAKWIENPYLTVTYKDAGGGDFTGNYTTNLIVKHYAGEEETLVNPVKTDSIFDGWYTSDDGGLTLSDEPVTVLNDENSSSAVTLYAKWISYYTVTYKDRGGFEFSGEFSTTPRTTYYSADSSTTSLPEVTKDSYEFIGWYRDIDCTGSSLTSLSGQTGDITIYALWASPVVSFTIDNEDISVTSSVEEGVVTITAASGFKNYEWSVLDEGSYKELSEVITGASVSDDGKTLTFSEDSLVTGHTYFVHIVAYNKNGMPFTTDIQIKK